MILRLCIYGLAIGVMVSVMLGASWVLGPRRRGAVDASPFESGILPLHDTNIRIPSQFYLIAMFFVIFDLEMVFVFAWAVAVRPAGWAGYEGMLVFLAFLLVALGYLWRSGGLEWKSKSCSFGPGLAFRFRLHGSAATSSERENQKTFAPSQPGFGHADGPN